MLQFELPVALQRIGEYAELCYPLARRKDSTTLPRIGREQFLAAAVVRCLHHRALLRAHILDEIRIGNRVGPVAVGLEARTEFV